MANRTWNDAKYSSALLNLEEDDIMMVYVDSTGEYKQIQKQGLSAAILGTGRIISTGSNNIPTNNIVENADKDASTIISSYFTSIAGIRNLDELISSVLGTASSTTELKSLNDLDTHLENTSSTADFKHKASNILLDSVLLGKLNVYDALVEISTGRNLKYRATQEFTASSTNKTISSDRLAVSMGLIKDDNVTLQTKNENKLSSLPTITLYDTTNKTTTGNVVSRIDGIIVETEQINNSIVLKNVIIPTTLTTSGNTYIVCIEAGRIDASNSDVLVQSL